MHQKIREESRGERFCSKERTAYSVGVSRVEGESKTEAGEGRGQGSPTHPPFPVCLPPNMSSLVHTFPALDEIQEYLLNLTVTARSVRINQKTEGQNSRTIRFSNL